MERSSPSKKRTLIKRIFISVVSIVFILFCVLVVHIYQVTKPVKYDNNDLQLSRIDFKEDVDSLEAIKIRHFVASLPGVQNTLFNTEENILIYGYTNGKQNSENVFKLLMSYGNYKAEKFVVNSEEITSGCPMGKNRNSFIYKTSAFIYNCFN